MPTPGRRIFTATSAKTSASSVIASNQISAFQRDAAGPPHVVHRGDAVHDRAENHRRNDHADEIDEGIAEWLHFGRKIGTHNPQPNARCHRERAPETRAGG